VKSRISSVLSDIYSKGVISSAGHDTSNVDKSSALIYVQQDMKAHKIPVSEVYTVSAAEDALLAALVSEYKASEADSVYNAAGLRNLIAPDLILDQQTTEVMHRETLENISMTSGVFRTGQVIVNYGEVVTVEIMQLLDSYKSEFEASVGYDGNVVFQWIGCGLIALFMVFMVFVAIYYCNFRIFSNPNKYMYLLSVFSLATVGASVATHVDASLFYFIPFSIVAFYLLAFFKKRLVFIVYFISLLPVLMLAPNGMELFVMYLVGGSVGMLVFQKFNRGWLQFVTALIVFVVMVLVWGAFNLSEGFGGPVNYGMILYMAFGALLSVAAYPLIYLFEKIFKLLSNSKLVDLSDTSNKLLRMLADKAPGTFQHSLQVMNLADAVARAIDANVLLVRAGALYHDIGKIANPQCFTENETPGVRYHEGLSPKESAQEIIRHVSDGLALADKYGLPSLVKEFIATHHGTTCTAYFYNKYLVEGGSEADRGDFCYDGMKPKTKEQVVLMLCDAVEAASRSLKDYSAESISELVERITNGKIEDGQLSDSEISMSELSTAKEVMKSYIQQMYHARVAYPKRLARGAK
jgi:putative nucleotidyltransferase with HDIG domain